jgi:hypothetical protein
LRVISTGGTPVPPYFAKMSKTLLYRLFGVGRMPAQWRAAIDSEGIVLMDEGIGGSITYRDFSAPGRRSSWRKVAFSGSIALTKARLLALQYANPVINVPLDDQRLQQMQFSVEGEDKLLVAFNANLFHNDWSGTIEYRFRTARAREFLKSLGNRSDAA